MQAVMNIMVNVTGARRAQAQLAAVGGSTRAITGGAAAGAGALGRLGGVVGKTGAGMERFGKNMQWVGRQIEFNFALPILLATGIATKWALENERAMTRLKKVYGGASMSTAQMTEETEALGRAFRFLSDNYGVALSEVIDSGAAFAQAGAENIAIANGTRAAIELQILGEMELVDATEAVIAIQAQYGASSDDLRQILADLNAIENDTTASLPDLVAAMQRGGGIARESGVHWTEFAGMVAAMVPASANATQAGNSLKTMITRLMAPTARAREALQGLGIDTESMSWQNKTATERFLELANAVDETGQGQRTYALAQIFGDRQVARGAAMLRDMTNEHGRYQKAIEVTSDSQETLNRLNDELDIFLRSSPQGFKIMLTQIQNYAAEIAQQLLPTMLAIVSVIRDWIARFAELDPKIRLAAVGVALFVAVTGPLIRYMGATILLASQLVKGFHGIGLMAVAIATPIAKAAGAIGAFVKAIFTVFSVKGLGKISKVVEKVFGGISRFLIGFVGRMGITMGALGTALLGPWGLLAITVGTALFLFRDQVGATVRWVIDAFGALPRGIANALNAVVRIVRDAAVAVREWFSRILNPFGSSRAPEVRAPSQPINARAAGGPVNRGETYLVGEQGPEFFTARRGGSIIPADMTARMRGAEDARNRAANAIPRATGGSVVAGQDYLVGEAGPELFTSAMGGGITSSSGSSAAINGMTKDIKGLESQMKKLKGTVEAQEAVTDSWEKKVEAASDVVEHHRDVLDALREKASEASEALQKAEQALDKLANTPITGMRAAEDALFANEMAQKRVRLEIVKMGDAVAAHDRKVEASADALDRANRELERLNDVASAAKDALDDAEAAFDRLADMPITGMRAAEDAIFANSMAQKQLQLETAKVELSWLSWERQLKSASNTLDDMNDNLRKLRDAATEAKDALSDSQSELDDLADMPIAGMREMGDVIWDNEMAQKGLRLEMLKLEKAHGPVDEMRKKLADLQGDVERLGGKREDLRLAGAGSDVLGAYDEEIKRAQDAQSGLMNYPAAQMEELEKGLESLRLEAEILELEKSLQFDPLTRQIERMTDAYEEMEFSSLVSAIQAQKTEVDLLTIAYDSAEAAASTYSEEVKAMAENVEALEASGPTAQLEQLEWALRELQLRGEVMDLEKSLQFDPLIRQIEQLIEGSEEMSFSAIMSGLAAQKSEIDKLTRTYEGAQSKADAYADTVKKMEDAHKALEEGGPTKKIAALEDELRKLQERGEIMDLEKSLKFDPLIRQIDQLVNGMEEMPFEDIISGIKNQKAEVERLTAAYEAAEDAVAAQEDVLDRVTAARDAMQDVYDIEMDKLDELKDSYSKVSDSIGGIEQALGDAQQAFGDFEIPGDAFGLGREEGSIDDLIAEWEDTLSSAWENIDVFEPLRRKWEEFTTWMREKVDAIKAWLEEHGIDLTSLFKFEGVKDAWERFKAMFTDGALSEGWNKIREAADRFWEAVKTGAEQFSGPFLETWNIVADAVERIWERLKTEWGIFWDSMSENESFSKFWNGIGTTVAAVIDGIIAVAAPLWEDIMKVWEFALPGIEILVNTVASIIESIIQTLRGMAQLVMGAITLDFDLMKEGILAMADGMWDKVLAIFRGAVELAKLILQPLIDWVSEKWTGMKDKTAEQTEAMKTFFADKWKEIKEGVQGAATAVTDWVKDKWEGMKTKTAEQTEAMKTFISEKWNEIKTAAVTKWAEIVSSVVGKVTELKDRISEFMREIRDYIAGRWEDIKTKAITKWAEIISSVVGKVTELRDRISGFMRGIRDYIADRWEDVRTKAVTKWAGIISGIVKKVTELRDKISERWAEIRTRAETAFTGMMIAFGLIWDRIKSLVRTPIKAAVDVAINPIIRGINKIRNLVGLGNLSTITIPKFHKGGVVGDGYGIGPQQHTLGSPMASDEQLALLRKGERVLTEKQQKMYEGSPRETGDGIGAALIKSIKNMAFRAVDSLREMSGNVVRPIFSTAMKAVEKIAGGGTPFGGMIIKLAKKGGNAAIDWLSGVEKAAPEAPPLSALAPGRSGPGDSGVWRRLWSIIVGRFNTRARLASGYRPGAITATGNRSYHGMGRAVDLVGRGYMDKRAMLDMNKFIYANYKNQTRELIYSGAGAREVHNGRDHNYTGITRRNHFDHVHWAMDNGGFLDKGWNPPIFNGLGQREIVSPESLMRRIVREEVRGLLPVNETHETNVTFTGDLTFPNVTSGEDAEAFIRNLESMVG